MPFIFLAVTPLIFFIGYANAKCWNLYANTLNEEECYLGSHSKDFPLTFAGGEGLRERG